MKITVLKLYTIKSGDTGARGAAVGESQYWGGGWQAQTLIAPILLATGNLEFHPKAFHNIIHHHATVIIQPELQWMGGLTPARWVAAMAKPYEMPVTPHGASVYNYHFVMASTNSSYAEYLSVGKGAAIQPIFSVLEGEPLPSMAACHSIPGNPALGWN